MTTIDTIARAILLVLAAGLFGAITMTALGRPNRRASERDTRRRAARAKALGRILDFNRKDAA